MGHRKLGGRSWNFVILFSWPWNVVDFNNNYMGHRKSLKVMFMEKNR